jgi:hypothetical protein
MNEQMLYYIDIKHFTSGNIAFIFLRDEGNACTEAWRIETNEDGVYPGSRLTELETYGPI